MDENINLQNELANMTPEEMEELEALGLGAPAVNQGRKDIFAFFNKILKTEDTIKVSNLDTETELAPVRLLRDASLFAHLMGHNLIEEYFHKKAEIILGSALSKKGFLIDMAVTTKKESTIGQKERKVNKGWFKSKDSQA